MSQPSTQLLRELIARWREEWPRKHAKMFNEMLDELEALLPALDAAIREGKPCVLTGKRLEETIRAYCGRDMTEGIDWSSIAVRLNADAAPPQQITADDIHDAMAASVLEGGSSGSGNYDLEQMASALNAAAPSPPSELGNLKTAQDVAYRIFAEITVIPADAQEAKVIALISQAVAQARVAEAEWWAAGNHDKCVPECSLGRRLSGLKRDLAAIAKEGK